MKTLQAIGILLLSTLAFLPWQRLSWVRPGKKMRLPMMASGRFISVIRKPAMS